MLRGLVGGESEDPQEKEESPDEGDDRGVRVLVGESGKSRPQGDEVPGKEEAPGEDVEDPLLPQEAEGGPEDEEEKGEGDA